MEIFFYGGVLPLAPTQTLPEASPLDLGLWSPAYGATTCIKPEKMSLVH